MRALLVSLLLFSASVGWAQERSLLMPRPNTLFFRVIDTGSGTATLMVLTGATSDDTHVMMHDVGHWDDDYRIRDELRHYLADGEEIDVMIVSHSDSDHLGAADTVLEGWRVRSNVRTGWERDEGVGTYWSYREALATSVADNNTEDYVIGSGSPALGEAWPLGEASVTFLSGFDDLPNAWDVGVPPSNSKFDSKARNAVSIVVRVDYAGRSILLPGDAVGRLDKEQWSQLIGTEKFLVEHAAERSIKADILLAPHHGADNASSLPFIQAVQPTWVIFSAGVHHGHPKFDTFKRYRQFGVPEDHILRTDRGDQKYREDEWWGDWDDACRDKHGDDGISILIQASGTIAVDQDPVIDLAKGC